MKLSDDLNNILSANQKSLENGSSTIVSEIINRITKERKCIGENCNNIEGIMSKNFAGRNTKSFKNFPFPDRIEPFILPGVPGQDFLCEQCASKYPVECRVHGQVSSGQQKGWPPICISCQNELYSISDGRLAGSFTWILPLTLVEQNGKKSLQDGFLARSRDGMLHISNKTLLASFPEHTAVWNVEFVKNVLGLTVSTANNSFRCMVDGSILCRGQGPWEDCWKPSLGRILGLRGNAKDLWLVALDYKTVPGGEEPNPSRKLPSAFAHFDQTAGLIRTFPQIDLPALKYLTSKKKGYESGHNTLTLEFSVGGLPHTLTLTSLYPKRAHACNTDLIHTGTRPEKMRQVKAREAGATEDASYLLTSIHKNSIQAKQLPSGIPKVFSYGFEYNNRFLLISNKGETLNISMNTDDQYFIKSTGTPPPIMLNVSTDDVFAFFFDPEKPESTHSLRIGTESLSIDRGEAIPLEKISQIGGEIANNGICRLTINVPGSNGSEPLVLVGPEPYIIEFKRILDTRQAKARFKGITPLELYEEYHELKKYNQLTILFGDIVLLDQELNREPSIEKIHGKLSTMSVEKFYEDKTLREQTVQKILIFSMFLPEFRKKFEYFSSMYPYLIYENEAEFLMTSFGADVAQQILHSERQIIIQNNRQNVRQIQTHIQRSLAEIERAISPIEEFFIREELRKKWATRIDRHLPIAGQAILAGGSLLVGGPAGMLAGMLAIRAMGDILRYIQGDKETAGRIKKAAEKIFPWWHVFKDTLTVSVYEASEFIGQENRRCMLRDIKILESLPGSRKKKAEQKRDDQLRKRIIAEKENRYTKVLEGGDVRFDQIEANLRTTVDTTIKETVDGFIKTIPYLTRT